MSRASAFLLLLPLIPLLGAFVNRAGAIIGCVIALGGLAWSFTLVSEPTAQVVIGANVLLALGLAFISYFLLNRRGHESGSDGLTKNQDQLKNIKQENVALKATVAKAEQEEKQSVQIYGVAKSLAESISWKDMGPRLSAGIQKLFGAFEFLLYGIDAQGAWTLLQRRGNWAKEPPIATGLPGQSAFIHPPQVQELVPVLVVPVYATENGQSRVSGMLFLKSSDRNKSEAELIETGQEFGEQLGVALSKALLFNQMEIFSRVDGLTGMLRRQPFMDRLQEEIKKANAFNSPFSVLMVDIDHFKAVNDGHGHAAGDAVLARTGQILKESFYETDVVGRYGGEEFIVLLPHAEKEGVMRKAESLRKRFEMEVIQSGFENLKITVSIGLAHFPANGRDGETLIHAADKALYRAKETGRNKVVAA